MTIKETHIAGNGQLQIIACCYTCPSGPGEGETVLDTGESGIKDTRKIAAKHDNVSHGGNGQIAIVTSREPMGYGTMIDMGKTLFPASASV